MAAGWLLFVLFAFALTYRKVARVALAANPSQGRRRLAVIVEAVAAEWIRRTGLYSLVTTQLPQLVRYCSIVYERVESADPAFAWTVKTFLWTVGGWIVAIAVFLADVDDTVAALLSLLAAVMPVVFWRDLTRKVERRKEAFVSELPTFMHKLSLLLSAGETLHRAWHRASAASEEKRAHPLYAELAKTCRDVEQGVPFPRALEELHRRCGFYEVSALVTTVLMNYKRGGDAFALSLQDSARFLMEKKHALVRTKGEQASAKLLFPMMLMLFAVMIIVAAPAVMMMN